MSACQQLGVSYLSVVGLAGLLTSFGLSGWLFARLGNVPDSEAWDFVYVMFLIDNYGFKSVCIIHFVLQLIDAKAEYS